jgi:CrcB protein
VIWLAIGAGGALGAMARHALNMTVQSRYSEFPIGIFVINAVGCLAIGLLAGAVGSGRAVLSETGRLFLVVGVLGGFTTFSAFSLDTLMLARGGQTSLALANAIGQVVIGVAAVWIGFNAGSWRP